jgi:hypothetical protein
MTGPEGIMKGDCYWLVGGTLARVLAFKELILLSL